MHFLEQKEGQKLQISPEEKTTVVRLGKDSEDAKIYCLKMTDLDIARAATALIALYEDRSGYSFCEAAAMLRAEESTESRKESYIQ